MEHFVSELTAKQPRILAYIFSAIGNRGDSHDVLQNTNLVLWRKAGEYREGDPFLPWALAIARFEVLAYYRDRQRERLVFEPDIGETLAGEAVSAVEDLPNRQIALRYCLGEMSSEHRGILRLRYADGLSTAEVAQSCGRSLDGVKSLMLRLRKMLAKCIEGRLTNL